MPLYCMNVANPKDAHGVHASCATLTVRTPCAYRIGVHNIATLPVAMQTLNYNTLLTLSRLSLLTVTNTINRHHDCMNALHVRHARVQDHKQCSSDTENACCGWGRNEHLGGGMAEGAHSVVIVWPQRLMSLSLSSSPDQVRMACMVSGNSARRMKQKVYLRNSIPYYYWYG